MSFEGQWHQHEFELPTEAGGVGEEQPNYCVHAAKFNTWAQELCVGATQDPSVVKINQGKVLLVDKYMQWKTSVPKRHRLYTGSGHDCIFHVFETAYDRLRVLELSLTPPMLFVPPPPLPPPPPPAPPQIAGVFLGELDG
jgi:hypothetical protein